MALCTPGSGVALLRTGAAAAAERELRQARSYRAPDQMVVPPLLQAMLTRGEFRQLLDEFSDPQQSHDVLAPDILRARAVALQALGKPAEANEAMDRSLALRRDAHGLATRAQLAGQQNNGAFGLKLAEEALKLAPNDEDTLTITVLLLRQQQQAQKALTTLNDFVARNPKTIQGRSLRADTLLALNQIPKAKEDADWLVANASDRPEGNYFEALITARTKDAKAGWREANSLPPEFVQSNPAIALAVAQLAVAAGSTESGAGILAALVQRHPDIALARVQLAVLRLIQNNPDLALQTLQPLLASDDPRVQALIAQADLQTGHYREAMSALEKATAGGGVERGDILKRQLAQSELLLGYTDKAVQQLQELLAQDPQNTDAAVQLADILAGTGKSDQALAELNHAAQLKPKNPLPAFYRGQILAAGGKLAAASAAFSQAAATDPKFLPAFYARAKIAISRGSPEDAVKDLDYVTTRDPANTPAHMLQAQMALDSGHDAEALAILATAIRTAPNDPVPRLALARYQMGQRKFTDAQATLSALLRISQDNRQAIALQSDILFATGDKVHAVETFRQLVTKYPNAPEVQIAWSRVLNRVNDRLRAETAAAKAADLAPAVAQYRSDLIALQLAHGKPVDALLTARAWQDLHPGPEADLLVSGTLLLLKRDSEAEAILEKSFSSNQDSRVALALAAVEFRLGKGKRATEVVSLALQKSPDDFELRRQYALMLIQTGDSTGARREFEALLKQRPDDPGVLENLGRLLQKDDATRALSLVSLAAKISPRSAPILDSFGWMKFHGSDKTGALPLLDRAHSLAPQSPEFAYHYAVVLEANGKREEAKALLKAVLAKTPKFDDANNARELVARW